MEGKHQFGFGHVEFEGFAGLYYAVVHESEAQVWRQVQN